MTTGFNIEDFRTDALANRGTRYEKRMTELRSQDFYTKSVESAVAGAIDNIQKHKTRSFVIYGEPQSGKTGMMIALTAKLLDEGHKIIILLLNDSVQLLEQNLERFLRSGLDPAPKKFSDILDAAVKIGDSKWVIFCKKNSGDLQKLIAKVGSVSDKVIMDDEADFATPNSKVNKENEKTKINELVGKLLGSAGKYIGVTATPARLDLNNTFENNNEKWIDFPPHPYYTGQDVFFPTTDRGLENLDFGLRLLPNEGDNPKHLREAFFSFLVNVAYLNLNINESPKNYSMLIHTSGKKADHTEDYKQIIKLFNVLKDDTHKNYASYVECIYNIAQKKYPGDERSITAYILMNIDQNDIIVMNSNADKKTVDYKRATEPSTIFTIAIGGNIVSRGVTFESLLSMFFTRDVKHKIQQDTYIQRARMFGSRGDYLKYFELHIPEKLYFDWQKCFVFHKLALSFIRAGKGSPVWLEDKRVSAASSNSIDKATVALDSGEMSWDIFDYEPTIDVVVDDENSSSISKLSALADIISDNGFPQYVRDFIKEFSPYGNDSVAVHRTTALGVGYESADTEQITRSRGFISTGDLEKERFPRAMHHIKIFRNDKGKARVFYKYTPDIGNIRFLKNMKASK